MMDFLYVLRDKIPIRERDYRKWAVWFETSPDRIVARTTVGSDEVSTVFLGIDHRFGAGGPPLLFETMVFPKCDYTRRCSTWEEAETQHRKVVEALEAVRTSTKGRIIG